MFKKGDILVPYENRRTSNGIRLPKDLRVEVLDPGAKIRFDTKRSVPVKIIQGSTSRSSGYVSRSSLQIYGINYNMSTYHNKTFNVGDTLIIFADGFKRISTSEHATSHGTIGTGKNLTSTSNINPHVLMCMLN